MSVFFSILIPTYNRPLELERAVASVLAQTFTDFELIVVNNASENLSIPLTDNRIKVLSENQKGGNYARNTGIRNAQGQFVCFLDDDDEYLPNHLETLQSLVKENNSKVGLYKTFAKIEKAPNVFEDQPVFMKPADMHSLHYIFLNLMHMSCVCIHRSILGEEQFNPDVKVAQDYDLWIRILVKHPLFISPAITTVYHYSVNSISKPSKEKYYYYINLFNGYFDNPKYGSHIPRKIKRDRIFRYYYWIFCDFRQELSSFEYLKVLVSILRLKPEMLFKRDLFSLMSNRSKEIN